jgi:hypothetical protein
MLKQIPYLCIVSFSECDYPFWWIPERHPYLCSLRLGSFTDARKEGGGRDPHWQGCLAKPKGMSHSCRSVDSFACIVALPDPS